MEYQVRMGIGNGQIAPDYDALISRYRTAADDGKETVVPGHDWPEAQCLDCGTTVRWAEAGYVPGHRICPACGGHFGLYEQDGVWRLRRARFY